MAHLHDYNSIDLTESESRWLVIFTKRAFIGLLVGAVPGVLMIKLIGGFIGIIIFLIIELIAFGLTGIPLPSHWILKGGGLTLDIVILRKIVRWMNRCLYVLQYDDPDELED